MLSRLARGLGSEAVALLVVLAAAAFLRLFRLGELPPGLYHDEAVNGINGLDILAGKQALFFGEREPLYMYLVAAALRLMGPEAWAIRATSALVGLATVLAVYLLAREMMGRGPALLAAAGLATSLWHIMLSRVGFRAVTLPLLEALAFYFLWRALRTGRLWCWGVGGALLGLSLYTYIASRVLPALVLLFLAGWWALGTRRREGLRPWGLGVYLAAALIAFAPLLSYFLSHPETFAARAGQVAASGELGTLLTNAGQVAGMFFAAGDPNSRHNLPGRPVFDPLLALFFTLGLFWVGRRPREPAHLFLALWLPLGLLPTALSEESPHYLRASAALPAVYILLALGLAMALDKATAPLRRWPRWRPFLTPYPSPLSPHPSPLTPRPSPLAPILVLALLAWGGGLAYRDYFLDWAQRPDTQRAFNAPLAAAARSLAQSPLWHQGLAGPSRVYITTRFYQDRATIAFFLWPYLPAAQRVGPWETPLGVKWFDDGRALVLPPAQGPALYLLQDPWALEELRRLFPDTQFEPGPGFVAATVHYAPWVRPPMALEAAFAPPLLRLEGYAAAESVRAGEVLPLVLWWRIEQPAAEEVAAFAHLLDPQGEGLTGADGLGYPPGQWALGERVLTRHPLPVPIGTPPGRYGLEVGAYFPQSGRRLSLPEGLTALPLPSVEVRPGTAEAGALALSRWLRAPMGPDLVLLGYEPAALEGEQGHPLPLVLYWQAPQAVQRDYLVRLQIVDAVGKPLAEIEEPPAWGKYPTGRWEKGEIVRDLHRLPLKASLPPGQHRLWVSLRERGGGAMTPVLELGLVRVKEPRRQFAAPPMAHRLAAQLGGRVELLGYDLSADYLRPGETLRVVLYWRAQAEMDASYKVFVHLLEGANRGRLLAQADALPLGGARPTTSWLPGEVLADSYELRVPADAPAGQHYIAAGMYEARSGRRLPVLGQQGPPAGDLVLLPPVTVAR